MKSSRTFYWPLRDLVPLAYVVTSTGTLTSVSLFYYKMYGSYPLGGGARVHWRDVARLDCTVPRMQVGLPSLSLPHREASLKASEGQGRACSLAPGHALLLETHCRADVLHRKTSVFSGIEHGQVFPSWFPFLVWWILKWVLQTLGFLRADRGAVYLWRTFLLCSLSIICKECLDKISLPGNCDKVLSVKQEWLKHTFGQLE